MWKNVFLFFLVHFEKLFLVGLFLDVCRHHQMLHPSTQPQPPIQQESCFRICVLMYIACWFVCADSVCLMCYIACWFVCADSVCLMCYIANGHIVSFSLPSLKPLYDEDFLPLTDYRYGIAVLCNTLPLALSSLHT